MSEELEAGRVYFELASGQRVSLNEVLIQVSTLGVLEGRFDVIREHILAGVPGRARRLFGKEIGLCVLEPPAGTLPTYLLFASLICREPVREGDFSSLLLAWFEEHLPPNIERNIGQRIHAISWNQHAVDGWI